MNKKLIGITFAIALVGGFAGGWLSSQVFTKEYSLKDSHGVKRASLTTAIDGTPLLGLWKQDGTPLGTVVVENNGLFFASNKGKIQQWQSWE